MPTRDDYERLFMHEIKPGDVVRVPVRDLNEYHAQRMTIFRLIKTMKSQGIDVSNIVTRKHTSKGKIYVEIEHLKDDPTFVFISSNGKEEERTVPRTLKTREDLEFEDWMSSVYKLKNNEDLEED